MKEYELMYKFTDTGNVESFSMESSSGRANVVKHFRETRGIVDDDYIDLFRGK